MSGVEEIATKYASELSELKCNSKPLINSLTMMAEDYIKHAPVIVQTIESHLRRVKPELKLPVLYLIDSIVKNVKKEYVNLFTQNIVSTFTLTFELVPDKIKTQMWKLRQTWNDVFPTKKLYSIDYKCHQTDSGWPITAAPPSTASIHVNPKFLARALTNSPATTVTPSLVTSTVPSPSISVPSLSSSTLSELGLGNLQAFSMAMEPPADITEAQMREQLLMKQKELLELQTKKLELELLHTKAQLEEKTRKQHELHSKQQSVPVESHTMHQLLQQAQMAKHQTDLATTLLSKASSASSNNSSSSVTAHPSHVASSSLPSVTTTVLLPLPLSAASSTAATSSSPISSSQSQSSVNALPDPRKRREKDRDRDRSESKHKHHHKHNNKAEISSVHEMSGSRVSVRTPMIPPQHQHQLTTSSSATLSHAIHPIGILPPMPVSSATITSLPSSTSIPLPDPRKRITPDKSIRSPNADLSLPLASPSKDKDHIITSSSGSSSSVSSHRSRSSPQSSSSEPRPKSLSPGKDKPKEPLLDTLFSDPRKRKQKDKDSSAKSLANQDKSVSKTIRERVRGGNANGTSATRGGSRPSSTSTSGSGIELSPILSDPKDDIPSKRRKKSGESSGGSGSGSGSRDKDSGKEKRSSKGKSSSSSSRHDRDSISNSSKGPEDKDKDKEGESHGRTSRHKDDYKNRKKTVLMRNYRRTTEVSNMDEEEDVSLKGQVATWKRDKENYGHPRTTMVHGGKDSVVLAKGVKEDMGTLDSNELTKVVEPGGDVDFRYESLQDVDLRSRGPGGEQILESCDQPPLKKPRNGNLIDDLFGREDVDLRQHQSSSSSSWSQMKNQRPGGMGLELCETPLDNLNVNVKDPRGLVSNSGENESVVQDEDIREMLGNANVNRPRPPPTISPANSIDSNRSSCDPLGRPLLYNRLPDDPAERKRSLDSRTSSIDPVERFRSQYIERAAMGGDLSNADLKKAIMQAQHEFEMQYFSREQYDMIVRQLMQINEVNKIREVQQMQQARGTINVPGPNPWTESESNDVWNQFSARGPTDFGPGRFPTPVAVGTGAWGSQSMPMNWGQQQPRGPNPFEEAAAAAANPDLDDLLPPVNRIELEIVRKDTSGTIPIDKVMRQVRFYDETAIVLQGSFLGDEPREISFHKSVPKNVFIDQEREPVRCFIGKPALIYLDRKKHNLRLGAPTREFYIDGDHYEACFGGPPVRVRVDRYWHTFKLEGPPPQVEVGKVLRYDLLAGRVNLFIDGNSMAVYLDEKPQFIDLCGFPVILRFCNGFNTVLLNGRPFPTNFGGLPMSVTVPGGRKHYLRLSALSPNTRRAMVQFVRAKTGPGRDLQDGHPMADGFGGSFRGRGGRGGRGVGPVMTMGRGGNRPPSFNMGPMVPPMGVGVGMDGMRHPLPPGADTYPMMTPVSFDANPNPLDVLANIMPSDIVNTSKENSENHYEIDNSVVDESSTDEAKPETEQTKAAPLDVQDLLSKLMMAGLLPAAKGPETGTVEKVNDEITEKMEVEETEQVASASPSAGDSVESKETAAAVKEEEKEKEEPVEKVIPPLETVDVSWDKLKERRDKLIAQICTGVQCGSCGLRFPPDQNVRYSQHLDWHFRQNRREKANARKALSRKWYYDLSDWVQFAEIEDLEERAQSLFETQDIDMEGEQRSPGTVLNPDLYTVLSAGYEGVVCPQCNEGFESFFDEDKEEWRLRDAHLADSDEPGVTKLYHPICHQDYMAALQGKSTLLEINKDEVKEEPSKGEKSAKDASSEVGGKKVDADDDEEVMILKEGKPEPVVMDIDIMEEEEEDSTVNAEDELSTSVSETRLDIRESENMSNETVKQKLVEHRDKEEKENTKASENQNVESMICIDVDDDDNNDEFNNKTESQLQLLTPTSNQLQMDTTTSSCITHIDMNSDTRNANEIDKPNENNLNDLSSTSSSTYSKNISVNVLSSLSGEGKGTQSPATITIPDDETNDEEGAHLFQSIAGQVFDIALGNSSHGFPSPGPNSNAESDPTTAQSKRIIYESMKFDIPTFKIKTEPVDPEEEENPSCTLDYLVQSNLEPIEVNLEEQDQSPPEAVALPPAETTDQAVDIDLTGDDDDTMDTTLASTVAALDGNFLFNAQAPARQMTSGSKIVIRIADAVLNTDSQSPQNSPKNSPRHSPETPPPSAGVTSEENADHNKVAEKDREISGEASPKPTDELQNASFNKGIVHNIVLSNNVEDQEKMERLKPRLVGRKLVNYPPKSTGKETSGLCTIC